MEMNAAHGGGLHQGFPCSLLPGSLSSRGPGPPLSLVFRTEDVWQRCNQFIETSEFLIGVSPSLLQCRQGRTRMDEGSARCTMHAVVVLCFGCWQGLANRSMRIQDLYVGPVPIPRFIKEYSYSLFGTSGGFVISFSGSYVLWRFISPSVVE